MEKKDFQQRADSGALFASQSKKNQASPDYYGTIAINMNDKTNFQVVDGLTVIKLGGWKRKSPTSGKTYLSLSVNRFVGESHITPKKEEDDSDIPF
jgi:hypothetical protein